jgi:hypothetical protein
VPFRTTWLQWVRPRVSRIEGAFQIEKGTDEFPMRSTVLRLADAREQLDRSSEGCLEDCVIESGGCRGYDVMAYNGVGSERVQAAIIIATIEDIAWYLFGSRTEDRRCLPCLNERTTRRRGGREK